MYFANRSQVNPLGYYEIDPEFRPTQIGVSGGRTSGYLWFHVLDAHNGKLPENVYPTFQNTGEECEATYTFLHEMETRWHPLTWLEYCDTFNLEDYRKEDGSISQRRQRGQEKAFRIVNYQTANRTGVPFDMMLMYYAEYRAQVKGLDTAILPTLMTRMCTSHLKIKTAERYMASLGHPSFFRVIGIRADEPKRFDGRGSDMWLLFLAEAKVSKFNVNDWWRVQPFNLALDEESIEGNCRHCFLKKPDKEIAIIKKCIANIPNFQPDAELLRWINREKDINMVFRRDRPDYQTLYNIAVEELITGKQNKYDFRLVPEFKCNCAGAPDGSDDRAFEEALDAM